MKRHLGDTVYFNGDALGTISRIQFAECEPITLHPKATERTTALKITLDNGSSFFEPLCGQSQ